MPKLKTNKAAKKRFKRTKNGKFLRHRAYSSHLKTSKTAKRRRNLRKGVVAAPSDELALSRLLPYG